MSSTLEYHCFIAVAYYARKLGGHYQTCAYLAHLWTLAADPLVPRAVVTQYRDLNGIAPSRVRECQLVGELKQIGALARHDNIPGALVLVKPPWEELDQDLKDLLAVHPQWVRQPVAAPSEEKALRLKERARREEQREREKDYLAELGKDRKTVRNVLANMAKKKQSTMLYAGKNAGATNEAVRWLTNSGASWADFKALCKAAYQDKSEDKPADIEYLFAPRNADYLAGLQS